MSQRARWTLRRRAGRVVLLNESRQILLLRGSDPGDPSRAPWWEIPGGGIDGGEEDVVGAQRELYEETGITEVEMGPCIWTQKNIFDFAGIHFDQDEVIFVAWCADGQHFAPARLEFIEAQAFGGHQWWDVPELLASDEPVLPPRLREFLPPIVDGDLPTEPVDITVESLRGA